MGRKNEVQEELQEEVQPPTEEEEEEAKDLIFHTQLAQNGQATIGKVIRSRLGIEPGDSMWFKVIKVVKPDGRTAYDAREVQLQQQQQ